MANTLITIATFDNAIDAHLASSKLESEGIKTYIFDEHIITLNPLYNFAAGGIKLKVMSNDAEKAYHILKGVNSLPYTNEEGEILKCPNCSAEKIYSGFRSLKSISSILAFVLSVVTLTYPIHAERKYKCGECAFEFKE